MTDAAVDPNHADPEGNVFRRKPRSGRPEAVDDGLTSPQTRESVHHSLDQLSRTILSSNPRTLEDLVRDMMRPLLREWLEANLPDIVERQVRQEIDRVSGRGR
jgi:cell pole-organizing protein PopZ